MANGKVITGFSMPFVALYAAANGTVTYSGGIPLARGVNVSVSVEGASDNDFYADNVKAETDTQAFQSGTVTLEVDGLKEAARKLIAGVTATRTVTVGTGSETAVFEQYDNTQVVPYVGIGFVVRYMENGVTTYGALVLTKCKFNPEGLEAATQEEEISFQTTSLEAELMRDDSSTQTWKLIGPDRETEAAAVADYKGILTPAA